MSFGDTVEYRDTCGRRLGEILSKLLREKRFYERRKYGALVKAWQETVGSEIASHTRIRAMAEGRLVVDVDSPVLLQELSGFMCGEILGRLQRAPGGEDVAELRFRLGRSAPG